MRIISGIAKGRPLKAPEGLQTRPVTDKIRESLFNIWMHDIEGCDFLDLFSGSGSMGIEAMSRHAHHVVMVDLSSQAIQVIQQNIRSCHLQQQSHEIFKEDVFKAIDRFESQQRTFDIIYLDPPFTVDTIFLPVMESLSKTHLLKEDGQVVIRTLKEKVMPDQFGSLHRYRTKTYGISTLHFYQWL